MHYTKWKNRDIWVVVEQPAVRQPDGKTIQETRYVAAFRIDNSPALLAGEYLREGEEVKWFATKDEAAQAAFEEAVRRIDQAGT